MLRKPRRLKRRITVSYWKLIDLLRVKPSGTIKFLVYPEHLGCSSKEYVKVSQAHKVCLLYLIYLEHRDVESLEAFIQASIHWRKKYKELGSPRTKLEKIARVAIRRLPKAAGRHAMSVAGLRGAQLQMEKKIGIHSPDYPHEKRVAAAKKAAEARQKTQGIEWWIIDPDGNKFKIKNLNAFCREHGLCPWRMKGLAAGHRADRPGEYSCRRVRDPEL